jgi:integrase
MTKAAEASQLKRKRLPDTDTALRGKLAPGRWSITNAKSLYLNVTPQGGKSWVLRVVANGKRRELGLGSYPDLSLAKAKEEAASYRLIARRGGDPAAERDKRNVVALTFEQAARAAYADHKDSWRNEKHRAQWINTLETYAFPYVGSNPVSTIESADVLRVLAPIWLTKPETARRVRQRMALVMDWAKAHGHRTGENPCSAARTGAGLPRQPKKSEDERHFAAMPYGDVPAFVKALHGDVASRAVALALEFLILTAARTGEVIGAKWSEIDLDNAVWTIPAGRMKAKRRHRVPLTARALEILTEAAKLPKGAGYVFPGTDRDRLSNMAFLMLLRRMGKDCTAHGFRSAFRDWASERTNFPHQVCEWALAHGINDKTEAAYNRTDQFDRRRKLMAAWESFVRGGAKIVSLRAPAQAA